MTAYIELTNSERMPIDIARVRRDRTSAKGKIRVRYLNICSNKKPRSIYVNGQYCEHRITRYHEIIKVNISPVMIGLPSGFHKMIVKLDYDGGSVEETIVMDYRARNHHNRGINQLSGSGSPCQDEPVIREDQAKQLEEKYHLGSTNSPNEDDIQ